MPVKQATKKTTRKTTNKTATGQRKTMGKTTTKKMTFKQSDHYIGEIRQRAYDIFTQKGYNHGDDMLDWLKAEKEITEKHSMV